MDQPRPVVQRVPSGRNVPLLVALLAVAATGVLVWRPWHTAPTGVARPTQSPEAVASSSPAPPTVTPDPAPLTPRPSLPPPDIGLLTPISEFALVQQPGSAYVQCEYSPVRDGRRYFRSMLVQPPLVPPLTEGDPDDIRLVSWHVELQVNRLEQLFDRKWQTVSESRSQQVTVSTTRPAGFSPLTVEYRPPREEVTSVMRVVVVVEWYTRNLELAGRGTVAAPSYLEANDPVSEIRTEGCRAVRQPGAAEVPPAKVRVELTEGVARCIYAQGEPPQIADPSTATDAWTASVVTIEASQPRELYTATVVVEWYSYSTASIGATELVTTEGCPGRLDT